MAFVVQAIAEGLGGAPIGRESLSAPKRHTSAEELMAALGTHG